MSLTRSLSVSCSGQIRQRTAVNRARCAAAARVLTILFVGCAVSIVTAQVTPPVADVTTHQSPDSGALRVMTYNIRYDNPDDGIYAWAGRRDELLSFVISKKIDVLCIQEGLQRQVAFLKEGQRGFEVRGVGRDDGKEKGEYSAIFFNAARFSCLQNGTFWLSTTPEIPSKGWDAALPRIVTWVRLYDSVTTKAFFVFNTHFDHQGLQAREMSARLLRSKIGQIAGDSPVVVAGDFNSAEDDLPYRILLSRTDGTPDLTDAMLRSLTPHEGPVSTFTGFEPREPEPGNRIDYLFVSQSIQVKKYTTYLARSAVGYLSDHLPVAAECILP
jgi:endonuclease/exonuclease/phosphatase family metal-dependent hydrolase